MKLVMMEVFVPFTRSIFVIYSLKTSQTVAK